MVVTASYGIGQNVTIATAEVTGYQVSPQTLTDGISYVTIIYTEMGQTCQTTQEVSVTHRLTAIDILQEPATLTYEYGDTLQIAGMVVQATYSDGEQVNISGYQHSPSALNTVGQQTITVSYSENGITQTTTFQVTVNRKSVAKPTWKGSLTYNGSSQSVNGTSYWNNFNTTYMTIGGTTSATNAGTYTATFTLGSNYRWSDGTTNAEEVNWTIAKAAGSLQLSQNSVAISTNNYSSGVNVTITRAGDGVISYTPTSVSGLTIALNGTTLNIRGNGSTAVSTTITVRVAEGTNYLAPSSKTITVTATYWDWGDENAVGDQDWWASLKTWARSASASERQACVGKTKKVSLSSAVLGANQALMRCIGYDRDGTGTLAFQTAGTLPNSLQFDSSSAAWIGSDARTQCRNFASRCSASNSITTVNKGTCPNISTGSQRNDNVTYNSETGWLPSEREMGLDSWSPLSTANSSTSKAECTQGYNAPYQYYDSNSDRIKYGMDASGNVGSTARYYWERSRFYNYSYGVCYVYTDGGASADHYNNSRHLAPAFVI